MSDKQDGFVLVCRRMQTLMRDKPTSVRSPGPTRLEDMIQRLGTISTERRAA